MLPSAVPSRAIVCVAPKQKSVARLVSLLLCLGRSRGMSSLGYGEDAFKRSVPVAKAIGVSYNARKSGRNDETPRDTSHSCVGTVELTAPCPRTVELVQMSLLYHLTIY